jgi:outer membrane protein OmpA-like peptidoglycan-associated protein
MKPNHTFALSILALAAFAGCSSIPAENSRLEAARSDYRTAQSTPAARDLAPIELKAAGDALATADAAWMHHDSSAAVDHLAYLAQTRVAIAQEAGRQKAAEKSITEAKTTRDQMRLAARTYEADSARRDANASQLQSAASQQQAAASQQQAAEAQRQALASQRLATVSQLQAGDAQERARQLELQIKELNAKKTERGLVVTIGDVLFDTNQSQLKPGGLRSVDKLVGFLKQYPQRQALIEGFTDSTGSDATNQALSTRRADAVRAALVHQGVSGDRLRTQGYGEAFPVAGNDDADGRRSNRRVEVILSDDGGSVAPR